jgi:hypothetical protein
VHPLELAQIEYNALAQFALPGLPRAAFETPRKRVCVTLVRAARDTAGILASRQEPGGL